MVLCWYFLMKLFKSLIILLWFCLDHSFDDNWSSTNQITYMIYLIFLFNNYRCFDRLVVNYNFRYTVGNLHLYALYTRIHQHSDLYRLINLIIDVLTSLFRVKTMNKETFMCLRRKTLSHHWLIWTKNVCFIYYIKWCAHH